MSKADPKVRKKVRPIVQLEGFGGGASLDGEDIIVELNETKYAMPYVVVEKFFAGLFEIRVHALARRLIQEQLH